MSVRTKPRAVLVRARGAARRAGALVRTELDVRAARNGGADLALFHTYMPPPSGGGNQFLLALAGELERRGLEIERNRISAGTSVCLLNSFNFDLHRLRRFARPGVRMVHRVDGPIGVYRGHDDGTDKRIAGMNAELADATVLQSRYSLERHRELGISLRDPVVIPNATDPALFHPPERREPLEGRRLRVVMASWSDNERKGADVLGVLDRELDPGRFELTFVGRTTVAPARARVLAPLPSAALAELLRGQDCYVAASLDDPCSNALLEALACGLPAVFRRSGGHPELVGDAGFGFDEPAEAVDALERLAADLPARRAAIMVPVLAEVADRYLEVLLP